MVPGIRYRAGEAWSHWKLAATRRRKHRMFDAWLAELRAHPPDVLIGANFDKQGGVGNHIQSIRRYSSLRVEPAPSDKLMASLRIHDFQSELRQSFLEFAPRGIRVLHSHVFPWFIEWCRKHQESGVRWVHTYHNMYFPEFGKQGLEPWQKEMNHVLVNDARHADVRISVSRWQSAFLEKEYGIPTIYLPNGVDVSLSDRADANRFIRKTGLSRFVLYAGRNDPVKNPADFVRLALCLPQHAFVMIGHDLTLEILRTEWEVGAPKNLYLYGSASRGEVQDALAACSILVVTSKREGLPTLVLEAMTHRKAVVVPDDAGCMEAVGQGKFGFIYRQGDLDDLAAKTLSALADTNLGPRARERVLAEYDWRVVAPKLDALYRGEVSCSK
ncbi:MAG TPA: glycosyltransferase family 4 protein [Verrucomicrobiota bacterium]|nr:glycosyltransferase family 4 protein [Verrucomicrobiota bacterium]